MIILFVLALSAFMLLNNPIYLLICSMSVLSFTITYRLSIRQDGLLLHITLFGLTIIKRHTEFNNIQRITFKRTSWYQKTIYIRLIKGVRWKLINFQPENLEAELQSLSSLHGIPIDNQLSSPGQHTH